MANKPQLQLPNLPEALRKQFSLLEKQLWLVETIVAFCAALTGILSSFLLLFLSDRLWETPVALRLALALITVVGIAWPVHRWLRQWILNRRDVGQLAVLVQRRYRRLGDRLLGIVELADERKRPADFSPELYEAAIQQVAAEASEFDFAETVSPAHARRLGAILFVLAILVAIPCLVVPTASWNVWRRWMAPASPVPRYTLVRITSLAPELVTPLGEPFDVNFKVQYRSFWKPAKVSAQYEGQPPVRGIASGQDVHLRIPGQVEKGILKIKIGDASQIVRIAPTARPALTDITASIALPAYLKYPKQSEKVQNGALTLLEGSQVAFTGHVTRPLAEANMTTEDKGSETLQVQAAEFSSTPLAGEGLSQAAFRWKDQLGLESAAPWKLLIQNQADTAPIPEIPDLPRDIAMLQSEVLAIRTVAGDDYGVREFGLLAEPITDSQETNAPAKQKFRVEGEKPADKRLEEVFSYSPSLYQVPADSTVELRAYATDYYPNREPSESATYRIHVLSNEQHAEMVRQRLEGLMAHLEEVTRLEEKVAANARALRDDEKLSPEDKVRKIAEAKDDQLQNAADLKRMVEEGVKTLQEALRNPAFSPENMREWTQTMQQMNDVAQGPMKEAGESLKSAHEKAAGRQKNVAQAMEKAEDSLEALQKIQKKANQGLDELQAMTLAQRLRKVGTKEKELGGQLQKSVSETVGVLPQDLPPRYQRLNAATSEEQSNAQKESTQLQGEISRFFERTQKTNYGTVSKEMMEKKVEEALEKIRGQIDDNIGMQAMRELSSWSERFSAWADLLEPKSESDSSKGENAGAAASAKAMKNLMELLRLREGQMNLKEQTRLAEGVRNEEARYAEGTKFLKSNQEKLLKGLEQVQTENMIRALKTPIAEAFDAMDATRALLAKPVTDKTAMQAHTKTINTLSDVINLINEQAQRDQKKSKGGEMDAAEMAFLMKMVQGGKPGMGMESGPAGGGNTSGGTTDRTSGRNVGNASGKASDGRKGSSASGASGSVPSEFRDALESYFNALEKESK